MTFTIICIMSFSKSQQIEIVMITFGQILFTVGLFWFEINLNFLKMNCFFVFNKLFHELALCIFMIGATILSFNIGYTFSESMLYYLEIVMMISMTFSFFIEFVSLLGFILVFVGKILWWIGKFFKKLLRGSYINEGHD